MARSGVVRPPLAVMAFVCLLAVVACSQSSARLRLSRNTAAASQAAHTLYASQTLALVESKIAAPGRGDVERQGDRVVAKTDSTASDARANSAGVLAPSAPVRADGAVCFEQPGKDSAALQIIAEKRTPVEATLAEGAAVYPDAEPETDVVVKIGEGWLEELRVLRSERAPHTVRYRLRRGPQITTLRFEAGSVEATDADGHVLVKSLPAFAVDARGTKRVIETKLDASGETEALMTLTLDATGLEYPIVWDPVWVSNNGTWPSGAVTALNSAWLKTKST
jgi:hypothetical protein